MIAVANMVATRRIDRSLPLGLAAENYVFHGTWSVARVGFEKDLQVMRVTFRDARY